MATWRTDATKLGVRHFAIANKHYEEAEEAHKKWKVAGSPARDWGLRWAVLDPAIICVTTTAAGIEGEGVLILQFLAKRFPEDKQQTFLKRFLVNPNKPEEWRTRSWEGSIKPYLAIALVVLDVSDFDWELVDEVVAGRNLFMHPKGELVGKLDDPNWRFRLLEGFDPDEAMALAEKANRAAKHVYEKYTQAHAKAAKLPANFVSAHVTALLSGPRR